MAFIQENTPQPNKIHTFSMQDFSGGLNNRSTILELNESPSVLNMVFTTNEVLEKRKGQTYFDEEEIPEPITFLFEYKPYDGEDKLFKCTNEGLYLDGEKVFSVNGRINAINHMGYMLFTDGGNLYAYGKFPQDGEVYTNIIGDPIDDYVFMKVVSPDDDHDMLDKEHVRGVLNVDYDDKKVYYEPCEFEVEDHYKGANVLPENLTLLASHNGRMYASGSDKDDDNVFITDLSNAFYFPVSLPIQMPPNSDKVVGLAVFDNSVVVGRNHDIHVIHGNTNRTDVDGDQFRLKKLNTHTGFVNEKSVQIAHNHLFFVGYDGNCYSISTVRQDERTLATQILSRTLDLEKEPIDLTREEIRDAVSIFKDDHWYVAMKDKVLLFSYRHMAWLMWDNFDVSAFMDYKDELIWSDRSGRVCRFLEDDYLDFDLPYEAHWHSRVFDMEDANSQKQFREFFLVAHTFESHNSTINIDFEIDYSDVRDRVTISDQIALWGKSKWGDRFITRNINASIPIIIGRRGRNIRIKVRNGSYIDDIVEDREGLLTVGELFEGKLVYIEDEESYVRYIDREWVDMDKEEDLNQKMRIYQVNGDYEFRGKR